MYEGLLDHTAKRASEPMLGLVGAKRAEPEIPLSDLEKHLASGGRAEGTGDREQGTGKPTAELLKFLNDVTGKPEKSLQRALDAPLGADDAAKLRAACGNDDELFERVHPFSGLLRNDTFDRPVVIRQGSVFVTAGAERRASGTFYTPRSLTEPIVQYTLEPLVYIGPAEGKPKEEWKLRSPQELLDLKICDMACGSGAFLVQACRYMAERLMEAWELAETSHQPGKQQPSVDVVTAPRASAVRITPYGQPSAGGLYEQIVPADLAERLIYARRIVAQRCLYGVDKNPLAAEMAKLSLWLLTLAKDKPFTFLDHAIRCGDSLVGIKDLDQIKHFNLDPKKGERGLFTGPILDLVDEAVDLRKKLETMPVNTVEDVQAKEKLLAEAEEKTARLRYAADMLISVEFQDAPDGKETLHNSMAIQAGEYAKQGILEKFRVAGWKALNGRLTFHWPLEFPEVMIDRGGFDAFIDNPPFQAGTSISTVWGRPYALFLKLVTPQAGNRADLAVYFLRRAFDLLRTDGTLGLVATNTVAEADSRNAGFGVILRDSGIIYWAYPNLKWPGSASLTVATFTLRKGNWSGRCFVNDRQVDAISSFLEGEAEEQEPHQLAAQPVAGFTGSKVYGDGFILSRDEGLALISSSQRNAEVIRPYWDGDQFNDSPTLDTERFIVNFSDLPRQEAQKFSAPFKIVEERVKPGRMTAPEKGMRDKWWQFQRLRKELYSVIQAFPRILMRSIVSKHHAFGFVDPKATFSHAVVVIATDSDMAFAILQSNLHECWAIRYGSKHETRPRYTISDCFHNFPLPECYCSPLRGSASSTTVALCRIGSSYHRHRSTVMLEGQIGLNKTYNCFHDPDEKSAEIQGLRDLHAEMDKGAAAAYGWDDLDLGHGFHDTKQGIRFTISESARREVLARLLKLNHERYAEEVAQGLHEKKGKSKSSARGSSRRSPTSTATAELFDKPDDAETKPTPESDRRTVDTDTQRSEPSGRAAVIDEIDTDEIMAAFRQAGRGRGWLEREELLKEVSLLLGYQRLGPRIEEALRGHLRAAIRRGIIAADGAALVRGATAALADYTLDELRETIRAVTRKGTTYEREEVIRAVASHLGFARLTDNSREAVKSALNSAIRQGILGYEGNLVWREE